MPHVTDHVAPAPKAAIGGWLPGLATVAAVIAAAPALGVAACAMGLLVATFLGFVVYIPLTMLFLRRGAPLAADEEPPAATLLVRGLLLVAWIATAWATAAALADH